MYFRESGECIWCDLLQCALLILCRNDCITRYSPYFLNALPLWVVASGLINAKVCSSGKKNFSSFWASLGVELPCSWLIGTCSNANCARRLRVIKTGKLLNSHFELWTIISLNPGNITVDLEIWNINILPPNTGVVVFPRNTTYFLMRWHFCQQQVRWYHCSFLKQCDKQAELRCLFINCLGET